MVDVLLILIAIVGVAVGYTRGVRTAVATFVFFAVVIPPQALIELPGNLPNLNAQRITLILLWSLYGWKKGFPEKWEDPLRRLLVTCLAATLVSTIFSIDLASSLKRWFSFAFEGFAVYYVLRLAIVEEDDIEAVIRSLVAAAGVASIIGLLQVYSDFNLISYLAHPPRFLGYAGSFVEARGPRAISVFPHPILFGGAMAISLPLAVYYCIVQRRHIAAWVIPAVICLGMYKSMSRGPILAGFIGIAVLLAYSGQRVRKTVATAFLAVLMIVVLIRPGIYGTLSRLYQETINKTTALSMSYNYRFVLLEAAGSHVITANPFRVLFGTGPGTFAEYVGTDRKLEERIGSLSCDSSWISFVFEIGLVGLVIIFSLFAAVAGLVYRKIRSRPDHRDERLAALLGAVISFAFLMTNVALYGWAQLSYVLWTVIGLAISSVELREKQSELMPGKRKAWVRSKFALPAFEKGPAAKYGFE